MAKVKNITLDEASDEQIRAFVKNFLNLELGDGEDPRSAMERAQPGTTSIFILEDEPVIAHAADAPQGGEDTGAGGMLGTLGRGDPRWKIIIPTVESDDNSGKNDVVVGVNGRAWQIKRGVEVSVPHRVIISLDNAITDIIRHDDDGNVQTRKAQRFPYQTLERPSQAEIEAWDARVSKQFCA
jgi:hypothetical protein